MSMRIEGLQELIRKIDRAANGELKRDMHTWLDAQGFQFLEEVQREVIRLEVVDTRRMLNSFTRGDSENVWKFTQGGLTLEVGTGVKDYPRLVNDGHFQQRRFVPGRWQGDRFIYDRNADTGMMLKAKWIEGKHFWENALFIFEAMFERSLQRNLDDWMQRLVR